jgi:hypothetical protein
VKCSISQRLGVLKRRIRGRLDRANGVAKYERAYSGAPPVLQATGIQYELAEKARGIAHGGAPLMLRLAKQCGLVDAIDRHLQLLKIHAPYHESDHVMNLALNALCDGDCLQDIELRRNDEAYLDALGTASIPDPTTAADFCRRFSAEHIGSLNRAIDEARLKVWGQQSPEFFEEAVIDSDGTIVETLGECKAGMDISYDGRWGFHPLVVTLANTGEVLRLVNRSGNRPSHEGAAEMADECVDLCRQAGFRRIRLRGDTDFSQTRHLDRWHANGVVFSFGMDANPKLAALAENLPETAWKKLQRPAKYSVRTEPRGRKRNIKRAIIRRRKFLHLELKSEQVAEFLYQPSACERQYRMIVIRKNISQEKGEKVLFDQIRYFFYISNDPHRTSTEVVFDCNDRCNQENQIAQLSGGVGALQAPVDNLVSNWAYMLMTSLAWTLKAWAALLLPVNNGCRQQHTEERRQLLRMEFKTFVNAFIRIPCQIVRQARRRIVRVLNWNPYLPALFRLATVLNC